MNADETGGKENEPPMRHRCTPIQKQELSFIGVHRCLSVAKSFAQSAFISFHLRFHHFFAVANVISRSKTFLNQSIFLRAPPISSSASARVERTQFTRFSSMRHARPLITFVWLRSRP